MGKYRVALYIGVLFVLASFSMLRLGRAEMTHASLGLGRDLLPLADLLGERAKVNINGEHVWASSGLTADGMHEILNRFEAQCRASGAGANVFRGEQADEGSILCFATESATPFKDRVHAFLDTQDLGELGRLRYAYVRRQEEGSHVLTMWSDDHLRLDILSGAGGGAGGSEPGSDHPNLPRPIRSRRTSAASIEGTPYGMHGYISEAAPAELLAAYTADMVTRGWIVVSTSDEGARGYMKDGSLVTVGTESTNDGTVIGIAEMGADPDVSPPRASVD